MRRTTHERRRGGGQSAALVLALLLALASLPATAHAYIDPGYGALFAQVVISGVLGALFLARKTIRRLLAFVARLFGLKRVGAQGALPPADGGTHPKAD
jgi:hypothetical protein